jgi:uncharacterized protein YndB with AHSA1/START domain
MSLITHGSFTLERVLRATPARVFAAWSSAAAMVQWFHGPVEWGPVNLELDFRVGGGGRSITGPKGGDAHRFESRYYDIVDNQRIVYAYEMYAGSKRMSVSLATIELEPVAGGTRLVLTEQGAFIDENGDHGNASREQGTRGLLEQLAAALEQA